MDRRDNASKDNTISNYTRVVERLKELLVMLSLFREVEIEYHYYSSRAKGITVFCDGFYFLDLTLYDPDHECIFECRNRSTYRDISTMKFDKYFDKIEEWIEDKLNKGEGSRV